MDSCTVGVPGGERPTVRISFVFVPRAVALAALLFILPALAPPAAAKLSPD